MIDFLLMLIELFLLAITVEQYVPILVEIAIFERGVGHFERKSQGKGASPTNEFWHQKTRVLELSYGEEIAENFNRLSRAHAHQRYRRQTTDGIAIACSERNVVTFAKKDSKRLLCCS